MFRLPRKASAFHLVAAGLVLVGAWQVAGAGWIYGKAQVAQWLIADAWEESLVLGGAPVKPWPWADTWPVARLRVPSLNVDQYVLAGASGHALAFGPGHHSLTSLPGHGATSLLAGHRDTHFSFLRRLQRGTLIQVQTADGLTHGYRVDNVEIVDSQRSRFRLPELDSERLVLLTCYPFDAVTPGGPLRYLVSAEAVETSTASPRLARQGYAPDTPLSPLAVSPTSNTAKEYHL